MIVDSRRRVVLLGLAALPLLTGAARAQPALSLAQRRAIARYEAEILPGLLARLAEAAGTEIPVEIDWTAIAKPEEAHLYLEPDYWTQIYFEPLIEAFAGIAEDPMGREAVAAGIRGIRITWDPATAPLTAYENGLTLADGLLSVNFEPYVNAGDVRDRAAAIRRFVENRL